MLLEALVAGLGVVLAWPKPISLLSQVAADKQGAGILGVASSH